MHTTDNIQLEMEEPLRVQVENPVSTKKNTVCLRFRRFFTLDVLPNEKHYYPIFIIIISILHISIHLTTYVNIRWRYQDFKSSLHDLWRFYIPCMRPTPYHIRMYTMKYRPSARNVTYYYGDELKHKCFSFLYPHQLWRLITVNLIHANWLHLLVNLSKQLLCGILLERKYGSLRIVIVYWLSNLGALLSSAMLADSRQGSVGASGAIYGLLLFFTVERLNTMKTNIHHRLLIVMQLIIFVAFPIIIVTSVATILHVNVVHSAHLGGGLVGFLFGIGMFGCPCSYSWNNNYCNFQLACRWIAFIFIFTYFVVTFTIFFRMHAPFAFKS
ncbi:unnamed protein product [Adineta steineri]|uniref:rhomboid protease n=1 Tax=Adineta steineri TaxID=433720 RepID=A0A815JJX6_9BILA|nr:unnamed protein product [Adineta steineri]CAF1416849.1 unnamed protein product [Adineta steineri]